MNEWRLDPEHGYRRARSVSWQDPNAAWQISDEWRARYTNTWSAIARPDIDAPAAGSEVRVVEWGQLRPGEWYPAVSESRPVMRGPDGNLVTDPDAESQYEVVVAEPL